MSYSKPLSLDVNMHKISELCVEGKQHIYPMLCNAPAGYEATLTIFLQQNIWLCLPSIICEGYKYFYVGWDQSLPPKKMSSCEVKISHEIHYSKIFCCKWFWNFQLADMDCGLVQELGLFG